MHRLDVDDLVRRYQSGESPDRIAESLGVSTMVVRNRLAKAGVPRRTVSEAQRLRFGTPAIDGDAARAAHEAGESVKSISLRLGVSRPAVNRAIKLAGGTIRGRSEAMFVRMASTTPEDRLRLTDAAHAAVRGVPQSEEQRCKVAASRQSRWGMVGPDELLMADWLEARGLAVSRQHAVGRYNVDVAVTASAVAVEVFGGHWHTHGSHAAVYRKRTDYLLDRGWTTVIVWATAAYPLAPEAADYVVALCEALRRGEPRGREEHVVWCQADGRARFKRERADRPVVPYLDSGERFRGDDQRAG